MLSQNSTCDNVFKSSKIIKTSIMININLILINKILLHSLKKIRLDVENVAVILGNSKAYLNVKGPYEKIVRVDCYNKLKTANIILLHLEKPINYNRECLPSFIPERYNYLI